MNSATELSDSYVTVWNEGDPERRRAMVAELWAPDGEHVLVPPQEVREAAAEMKMASVFEVRGHRELEVRVTDAYERFVAAGEYHSGAARTPSASATWSSSYGRWSHPRTAPSSGSESKFLVIDAEGRIRSDYQFIES
jgi:hypothetical protein